MKILLVLLKFRSSFRGFRYNGALVWNDLSTDLQCRLYSHSAVLSRDILLDNRWSAGGNRSVLCVRDIFTIFFNHSDNPLFLF